MLGSIQQSAAAPGDVAASSGQEVIVSVDLGKGRHGVTQMPAAPSQQNLNQFIQMNLIQL